MSIYLGIDIGTSGTKSAGLARRDRRTSWRRRPCAAHVAPEAGLVRAGPGGVVDGRRREASAGHRARPAMHRGRHQGHRPLRADARLGVPRRTNQVLRPALLWNDQRTGERVRRDRGGRPAGDAALIDLVANPAFTGFTAPKILWVRKHEPKVYEQTPPHPLAQGLHPLPMTGEYATEVSDAPGTLLLDVRDAGGG